MRADTKALLERLQNTPYAVKITPCEGKYEGVILVSSSNRIDFFRWQQFAQRLIENYLTRSKDNYAD